METALKLAVPLASFVAGCAIVVLLGARKMDRLVGEKERALWDLRKKHGWSEGKPTSDNDAESTNTPRRDAAKREMTHSHSSEPSPVDIRANLPLFTRHLETVPYWTLRHQNEDSSLRVERPPRSTISDASLSSSVLSKNPSLCESSDMEIPEKVAKRGPPFAPAMARGTLSPPDVSRFTRNPSTKWIGALVKHPLPMRRIRF